MLPDKGLRLRIYIGESDRCEGKPLYEWIVQQARARHMAGATVLRGMEGFGAHERLHTSRILRLSQDLPVIVEIVDSDERIESFIDGITPALTEGMTTTEPVDIRFHRLQGAQDAD